LSACSPLQPHEGSSGTGVRDDRRDDTARFNPTRVRLEPAIDDDGTEDIPLQPHEGSSGTDAAAGRVRREPRFNPTRVRLELVCYVFQPVNICPASTPRGFVWNSMRRRVHTHTTRFNPTRVRLEQSPHSRSGSASHRFNPTRVRLELAVGV